MLEEEKVSKILANLGLNELEIKCYLALLKKSPQRASELSRNLDVPKATVLDAIARLVNTYNIAKETKKKNFYLFSVEDPAHILRYLEQKQNDYAHTKEQVSNLLPELRGLQHYDVQQPKVYYFEGKEGVRRAFWQVLDEADEVIGYSSTEDEMKYLGDMVPEFYQKRTAKKIPVRAIMPATPFNIKDTIANAQKFLRPSHLIPAEYNYPVQVQVYKNTVLFFSCEENFTLMIKNKAIAECLKKIFEFAFEYTQESDRQIRASYEPPQ